MRRIAIVAAACLTLVACGSGSQEQAVAPPSGPAIADVQAAVEGGRCADIVATDPEQIAVGEEARGLAYYYVGFCNHTTGIDTAKAIQYYDRALETDGPRFWVLYNRGQLNATLGNRDQAVRDLQEAYTLNPEHPELPAMIRGLGATLPSVPASANP